MDDVEVFGMAEETLAEVLGRVGPQHRGIRVGPVAERPGWDGVAPLARLAERGPGAPAHGELVEAAALRSFLAHDVAMALGSRACPLPEALAEALFTRMEPDAGRWRACGVFRDRLPLPAGHVSWRDRFLLLAGRDPHPFD
ncbi:hypothetical protein [Pseudonocardia humida]|uniref:Uncharacterized protein n=1 Tax=Pseudonocardia humida TaxID=2800819 RepID=A0ABT1A2R7_9PSEU|nr:hypothetical protein [Pseudonocardia humida]MCO1657301.1 hypothetical protein [Pseudonocardia humida]